MSNVCVSGAIAPRSLSLTTRWMRVISYKPLLICFRGKPSATIVWRAGWSSAPFRTLCDVLLGLQCRSGRCVTCWLVFGVVPDAVWLAAWSSVSFRTLTQICVSRRLASRTTGLRYECVWIVAITTLAPHEFGYCEAWLYCCHKLAGTLQRPAC